MGAGRPPKPISILQTSGTFRKDRHGNKGINFPLPASIANPFDPKKNKAEALHWDDLAPALLQLGLLTVTSRATLIALCRLYRDIEEADANINENGQVIEVEVFHRVTGSVTGHRLITNPYVKLKDKYQDQYNKLLNEFGGNPSSAAKVASQKKPESTKAGNSFAFSMAGRKVSNL